MWPGMRPATGWMANLTSTPRLVRMSIEFADLVLGLGDGHAVAGNDDHRLAAARMAAASSGLALRTGRCFVRAGCGGLDLAEGAEQHVGERAVHRLAHDDREDEAGGAVEGAGDDQDLVVEHEAHRAGGERRRRR